MDGAAEEWSTEGVPATHGQLDKAGIQSHISNFRGLSLFFAGICLSTLCSKYIKRIKPSSLTLTASRNY